MKIKVISFNIRCCDDKDGNSVAERAPRLAAVCEPYDADVIGFQEYTPLWEKDIDRFFGEKYEIFNKYRTDTGHIESAPMLWKKDKFECLKRGCFWFSDTPEIMSGGWDTLGHNRTCQYAILKDIESGESLCFMNTHFGFGEENQVKSVHLIQKYAEDMDGLPVFITGDFNMTPESAAYAQMVIKMTDSNEVTVKDRRSTYHGYEPEIDKHEHIDYCFVNGRVEPISLKIIDELVDGKFPSDHFGVYIELGTKGE